MDTTERPGTTRTLFFSAPSDLLSLRGDSKNSLPELQKFGKTVTVSEPGESASASLPPSQLPEPVTHKVETVPAAVSDEPFVPVKPWGAVYDGHDKKCSQTALSELAGLTRVKTMATGGHSSVDEYKDSQDRRFAVKVLREDRNEASAGMSQGEILTLSAGFHPNIVMTHGLLLWSQKTQTFTLFRGDLSSLRGDVNEYSVAAVINEKVDGADVVDAMKGSQEHGISAFISQYDHTMIAHITIEVSKALQHLHDKGILYRDVKLDNILISKSGGDELPPVKLTDFGFCKRVPKPGRTYSRCGSLLYLAPEQILNLYKGKGYTSTIDHWGLGVCLLALAVGCFPVDFTPDREVLAKRPKGRKEIFENTLTYGSWSDREKAECFKRNFPYFVRKYKPFVDVIIGLTREDPTKRMSMAEVQETLKSVVEGSSGSQAGFKGPKSVASI